MCVGVGVGVGGGVGVGVGDCELTTLFISSLQNCKTQKLTFRSVWSSVRTGAIKSMYHYNVNYETGVEGNIIPSTP